VRHLFLDLLAGLNHSGAFGELVPNAIDLDIHEIRRRWSCGRGGSSFRGRHGQGKTKIENEYRTRTDGSNPIL
jgi:hypothetical protein